MKKLLPLFLLLVAGSVFGETCPNTEYAELKDMKREDLLAKYCELKMYQLSKEQDSKRLARNGEIVSLKYMKYSFKCKSEAERVAGILERQFSVLPPNCQKEESSSNAAGN